LLLLIALAYASWPVVTKWRRRNALERAAALAGPRARIALAYSQWRDLATDFGAAFPGDTPLAFVARTTPDEEHRQLAWLVTRALWGDLQSNLTADLAEQAELLSTALRKRLTRGQPYTLRFVALLSRRSLRQPFDASTEPHRRHRAAA
jgi:hypothetical protein